MMQQDTIITIATCSFTVLSNIVSGVVIFITSMHKKDLKAIEKRVEKIENVGLNEKWREDQTRLSTEIFAALNDIRKNMATKDDVKTIDARLYDHIREDK